MENKMLVENHENKHLIRLHEMTMEKLDRRITAVEAKINQIPWILLAALFNIALSLFLILSKYFTHA